MPVRTIIEPFRARLADQPFLFTGDDVARADVGAAWY